jgi:hypothetical protein
MARALTAKLPGDNVPARLELQTAIDALGFKCRLDADYSPDAPGYLACDLEGEDAGFNFRIMAEEGGAAMVLSWGGDPREEAAACIVCACLAEYFGATISRDGALADPVDLVQTAKRAMV